MINKLDLINPLKESILVALVACILFIPITGLLLKGWDFKANFMTPAVIISAIFIVRFSFLILLQIPSTALVLQKIFKQKTLEVTVEKKRKNNLSKVFLALILISAIIIPFLSSTYLITIYIQCLIYVLLGLGLNIVVGWAGMLDLGFVAFYAVGAYGFGLLNQHAGFGFWESLPIVIACAMLIGAILGFPVLRMHGDYLAIVTLGFGEIIRLVLNNWLEVTGGPNGLKIPTITFFGLEFKRSKSDPDTFFNFFGLEYSSSYKVIFIYLLLLIFVILVVLFCSRLKKMPIGRAWEALREDEIACQSMGINHVSVKLVAFMMGAGIGSLGGVFFATYQGFINPSSFTFIESALIVAIVVLGGLGSITGTIIAAIALNLLPELFREFSDFRIFIFGIVMVVMMIWRPKGLMRIVRPRFEINKHKN